MFGSYDILQNLQNIIREVESWALGLVQIHFQQYDSFAGQIPGSHLRLIYGIIQD